MAIPSKRVDRASKEPLPHQHRARAVDNGSVISEHKVFDTEECRKPRAAERERKRFTERKEDVSRQCCS